AQTAAPRPASAAAQLVVDVRAALSDDLDTPRVLTLIDSWCARISDTAASAPSDATATVPAEGEDAGTVLRTACDALLGVRL
ncbi:MAG TPA: cysteine--1-D-myo-inosityl 2-amino-2-deoxy-alpha-D-glucopyranoside ligase, partial [Corynebacterium variabile]|nr:cysteine--1-D-myo-inosityl 2-amino-2-deoxy-alpha-D-glucopyranoside ligase [Corynebacterium variabile]